MQSNETSEAKKVEENYLAMLSVLNTTTEAVKSANATGNVAVINVAKMSEMTQLPETVWSYVADENNILQSDVIIDYTYMGKKRMLRVAKGTNMELLKDETGVKGDFEYIATKLGINTIAEQKSDKTVNKINIISIRSKF